MAQTRIVLELEEIRARDPDRKLRPHRVVEFARRNLKSELHSRFEWNDSVAAERYRLVQARALIRVFVTVIQSEPTRNPFRMFVKVTHAAEGFEQGYESTSEAVKNSTKRRWLILEVLRRAQSILNSYPFPELEGLRKAVRKLIVVYSEKEQEEVEV